MTDPARVPRPVEQLIRAVAGGIDEADRDRRASTFARGLALGALVGAAVAGSTIWQRRSVRRAVPATRVPPATATAPEPPDPASEPARGPSPEG